MSIIDRLNLLVRSELSGLTSKGEKYRSTMESVNHSLRGAKRQIVELRRHEKNLIARIREVREKADKWEERAMLALKTNEEDLAKDALIVKNKALNEADSLRDELRAIRNEMRDLQIALEALEMKLEGARMKSTYKSSSTTRSERDWDSELARRKRKQDENTTPETSSQPPSSNPSSFEQIGTPNVDSQLFDTDRSFREFDRMSRKIGEMEAEIDAFDELSGDDWIDPRRRELEMIFKKMEKKKKTTDDLADLKKKFE